MMADCGAGAGGPRLEIHQREITMRECMACHERPSDTVPEYPPLCEPCLDRAGDDIVPGCRVACTVDEGCNGTVDRLEDEGFYAVVRTHDGRDAWVPVVELIRVTKP
jgi:hypothetical protein